MSRLDPCVAALRNAVRAALEEVVAPGSLRSKIDGRAVDLESPGTPTPSSAPRVALVACSGGADSLALAAATAFVAPRVGWRAGLVSVDHGLQAGSDKRAAGVAEWGLANGLTPSEHVTVAVGAGGGPEAAAREARYGALATAAKRHGAACVLLGHTEDDQAETVLLALARGSGPRGLAGMPGEREIHGVTFVRPLLGVSRETCRQACVALGLSPWDDPHNTDPSYARARVRKDVMPILVEALGADVVPNLARTAAQIGADAGYLDELAREALQECRIEGGLTVAALRELPDPLRTRVLHAWAVGLGVPRAALSHRHIAALDALITDWHGQGATQLPGQVSVRRAEGVLLSDNRS